jgi:hypothetical protein
MRFIAKILLIAFVALGAVGSASAIEVRKLTYHDLDHWLGEPSRSAAARHFADTTIQMKVTRRGGGGVAGAPPVGPLIMYLSKNGKLLSWTSGGETVGTGSWEIKDMGLGVQIPCYYFDLQGGRSDCFFGGTANYQQQTAGNPFGLKAGESVPARLSSSSTILSLAQKLGL